MHSLVSFFDRWQLRSLVLLLFAALSHLSRTALSSSLCSKKTDYIMYEMFDQQYCQEENRLGTYISRVPDYMTGHLQQLAEQMSDLGVDDYTKPEVAQYIECTPFQIQGAYYYFQIGCADGVTQKLAVNIYSDNTCSKKSTVDGFDDSVIDVSALNVSRCSFFVLATDWLVVLLNGSLFIPNRFLSNNANRVLTG